MGIVAFMHFPDSMKKELEAKGLRWSRSGEFSGLKEALGVAGEMAREMNMPVEVESMGTKRTVYPPALDVLGYGGHTKLN